MTATENKSRMQAIMAELANGNGTPFIEAMADEFTWTITGTSQWSKTYRGKRAVLEELMAPLFAQFADRYTNAAERILADGDFVVVQCKGSVTTKTGKPYNNSYCYVIRMADGRLTELTEYLDTALVDAALDAPG